MCRQTSGVNLADWIAVVVIALAALSGFRRGLLTGALSLAGLVAGALALPHPAWVTILRVASLVVVALSVAAVLARLVPARELAGGPAQE